MSIFQHIASVATIGLFAFVIAAASAEGGGHGGGGHGRRQLSCEWWRQLSCKWYRRGRWPPKWR